MQIQSSQPASEENIYIYFLSIELGIIEAVIFFSSIDRLYCNDAAAIPRLLRLQLARADRQYRNDRTLCGHRQQQHEALLCIALLLPDRKKTGVRSINCSKGACSGSLLSSRSAHLSPRMVIRTNSTRWKPFSPQFSQRRFRGLLKLQNFSLDFLCLQN